MCIFALLANYLGLGLDGQAIYESSKSSREFFTALAIAKKPFETTIFLAVISQLILTVCMPVFLSKARMFALACGLCGFHLSLMAGVFLLNVLLGEWPRS